MMNDYGCFDYSIFLFQMCFWMGCPMVKEVEAEEVLREERKQESNCVHEENFAETQEHMD